MDPARNPERFAKPIPRLSMRPSRRRSTSARPPGLDHPHRGAQRQAARGDSAFRLVFADPQGAALPCMVCRRAWDVVAGGFRLQIFAVRRGR